MKKENKDYNNKLISLASKYGSPLYVYDANIIKSQYEKFNNSFSLCKTLKLHYACKANTNLNILKFIHNLGCGLDTVSIQEVELGLKAGFKPSEIIFTPNGVSFDEIRKAVDFGVKINLDNIPFLEQFGHEYPKYPVGIRINPHVMAGGNSKISVGHIDSKFGISIHQLPLIKRIIKNTGLSINGLHMHTGSDIIDIDLFIKAVKILLDIASEFEHLEYVDFGSGFKVSYQENGLETDIKKLGKDISVIFNDFIKKYGKNVSLIFEPGKYLVSEAGYFLVNVNVIKQTTSTLFAAINTGFNHLIRPMFYDAYHEIINISNPKGKPTFYSVVGYICETDTFATNRSISEIRENDVLCFLNAGAYCFSMSSNYNSRLRPSEVLLLNGNDYLIRKRETIDDILQTTQIVDL